MAKKAKRLGWGWVNERGRLVSKPLAVTAQYGQFDDREVLAVAHKHMAEEYLGYGERLMRVEIRKV